VYVEPDITRAVFRNGISAVDCCRKVRRIIWQTDDSRRIAELRRATIEL